MLPLECVSPLLLRYFFNASLSRSSSQLHCHFPYKLLSLAPSSSGSAFKCKSSSIFFPSSPLLSANTSSSSPPSARSVHHSCSSVTLSTNTGISPSALSANISYFFFFSSSLLPPSSTSAKIRAIEAKLQMMEENPDDDYSGPSAYVYNKPPERKRWEPYSKSHHNNNQSRPFRKFRR